VNQEPQMSLHPHHLARRVRAIAGELGYAQRRLTEIRTGLELSPRRRRAEAAEASAQETLEELEALYRYSEAVHARTRAASWGR
jgi:hypothetical protein